MNKIFLSLVFAIHVFPNALFAGFPEILTDIDGSIINLKELASKKRVVVITIKTAECPVCQSQLIRIRKK